MLFTYQGNTYQLILFTLAGSRLYNTYYDASDPDRRHPFNPNFTSDYDWRGVFIAHPDTKLGLEGKIEEIEVKTAGDGKLAPVEQLELINELNKKLGLDMKENEDLVLYEIKKFISLALDANPNILDLIFADDSAVIYANKKGKKLRNSGKKIFVTTKTKFTFSGYAKSQLSRIKNHNKYIVRYPKTGLVIDALKTAFSDRKIDFNWIVDHFGGKLAEFVAGIKQQDANKLGRVDSISWDEFVEKYSVKSANDKNPEETLFCDDLNKYRKPRLLDYCVAKDLKAKKLSLETTKPQDLNPNITTESSNLKEFLLNESSFRTISKTQYNIFTPASAGFNGGIFTRNGTLKVSDPEQVGEFVCQLSVDESNYHRDLDDIEKLWEWRTGRNEKRSVLEEHFGHDVKHSSHLVRLLIGAKSILTTGEYNPRLVGDDLQLIRDILNGKKTYEWIVSEAEKMDKELETLYQTTSLPSHPDYKKANSLLLKLSREL